MGWFKEFNRDEYKRRMEQEIEEEARSYGEWLYGHMYGDYADDLARERLEERRNGPSYSE